MSKILYGSRLLRGKNKVPGATIPPEFQKLLPTIFEAVRNYGCDFYPTVVQFVTDDEMSEICAYGGFPVRYNHWRFGMEYERNQRIYELGLGKVYELVINNNPCYIYCQCSNTLLDNVLVVAHALGHNDFFKNNIHFSATDTSMMTKMANNSTRIRKYMSRWGKETVTAFIDHVLKLDDLIDPSKAWSVKKPKPIVYQDTRNYYHPRRLKVDSDRNYMDRWLNTKEWLDKEHERIREIEAAEAIDLFEGPEKDILGYLRDYAPLKPWQSDIISMLHEEAMYFAPQRATKMMNEGWACLGSGTRIPTSEGVLPIEDIVENRKSPYVYDGDKMRKVTNWFKFNKKTKIIKTARGFKFEGSVNHRVWDADKNWKRLDQLSVGEEIKLVIGAEIWAQSYVELNWQIPNLVTIKQLCKEEDVSYTTFREFRDGLYNRDHRKQSQCVAVMDRLDEVNSDIVSPNRKPIKVPKILDDDLGTFLGYMVGDGHISIKKRTMGLTTGDDEQSERYEHLLSDLFDVEHNKKWDNSSKNGRWRISTSSNNLRDFLLDLGLKPGRSAKIKTIPELIFRSPETVVSSFLRAYFDADGYAGPDGIILSTSSTQLLEDTQILLANFGILSRQRKQQKDNWHLEITGKSALKFYQRIGFGLSRKQEELKKYVFDRKWFIKEDETDVVVEIQDGEGDVYDFTVDISHRYNALAFMHHNSKIDYEMMVTEMLSSLGQKDNSVGIIEYASHKAGVLGGKYSTNPYKIGYCLLNEIEDRWNKGKFGPEWENCNDAVARKNWNQNTGLGKEKIFHMRKYYNDFSALVEFFDQEFCDKYEFFEWAQHPDGSTTIASRDHKKIKSKLLKIYANGGKPDIRLADPNHRNRYFLLEHQFNGETLEPNYAKEVLVSMRAIWKKPVVLVTKNKDKEDLVYFCDSPEDTNEVLMMGRDEYDKDF